MSDLMEHAISFDCGIGFTRNVALHVSKEYEIFRENMKRSAFQVDGDIACSVRSKQCKPGLLVQCSIIIAMIILVNRSWKDLVLMVLSLTNIGIQPHGWVKQ